MSFTNINDPAGVKALLDRLRASQAWQSLVNTPPALLSQLNSAPVPASAPALIPPTAPVSNAPRPPPSPSNDYAFITPPPPAPPAATEDVRSLTFQQALPRLAQLSDDPAVVSTIQRLKQEQDKLERELWAERTAIRAKYEEKVKVAKVKATLIGAGTGLSKHEADMLVQAYERELARFDRERALPAWDGLVTSQQAALAQLRVPTMFPTAVKGSREGSGRLPRYFVARSEVAIEPYVLVLWEQRRRPERQSSPATAQSAPGLQVQRKTGKDPVIYSGPRRCVGADRAPSYAFVV
ncbi:hypothetical protein B0H14DRAFT_3507124 [Mycena olivaceomarginata]|nr:hypothetical protein B0H14DRAFT_3507124 [Mycena olivaceomarginata]